MIGTKSLLRLRRRPSKFDSTRMIEPDVLQQLKERCLRAPSSFNAQPFRCVLVSDSEAKEELAHAMSSTGNTRRILQAPLTAVFLADTESYRRMTLLREDQSRGKTFAQRKREQENVAFVSGHHGVAIRTIAKQISTLGPIQLPEDPVVWSVKQTMLFVDHWILASTELGLAAWPMEGFDEHRVRASVGADNRYYCPVVVPTGYSTSNLEDEQSKEASPRLAPEEVFIDNALT